MRLIVKPAMDQINAHMRDGPLRLHQVFGANLFIAHAVDYMLAIREAETGTKPSRKCFLETFDELYSVTGARFSNRKFQLIDAINNALKHIQLDADRYKHLSERYGKITFRNLIEEDGLVLCILDGYRFDYFRVVLRPAFQAISDINLESVDEILEFSRGNSFVEDWNTDDQMMASDDPADAIDQMITHCNPKCEDCAENEEDCRCAQFLYQGDSGYFVNSSHANFDFNTIMSRISGAYHPENE